MYNFIGILNKNKLFFVTLYFHQMNKYLSKITEYLIYYQKNGDSTEIRL